MSAIQDPRALSPLAGAPADGPAAAERRRGGAPAAGAGRGAFADHLAQAQQAQAPLRFSRHALQRVQQRGITLDSQTLGRLSTGVARAAGKGSRDSVVLVDGTAFVVSVANRTVLTAVLPARASEPVFTNIDSAVIA